MGPAELFNLIPVVSAKETLTQPEGCLSGLQPSSDDRTHMEVRVTMLNVAAEPLSLIAPSVLARLSALAH